MTGEALDELIQSVLGGDAGAEERAQLERLLATSEEARVRHAELSAAFAALGHARLEEPPADLRESVMAEIRREAAARGTRAASAPARRPAFSWMRLALPLAACAAAAVVLVWNARQPSLGPTDSGSTSGTMAASGPSGSLTLGPAGRAVRVHWRSAGPEFQLELRMGDTPAHIRIEPVGAGVRMGSAAGDAGSNSVSAQLGAGALAKFAGTTSGAPGAAAAVRVTVTWPDGESASADVALQGTGRPE